jgi:primosomal replication protein N
LSLLEEVNNKVFVSGIIDSEIVFDHEIYKESFFKFNIKIKRLSDVFDILPVTISERLIAQNNLKIDQKINIIGQIRSYNNFDKEINKTRLILTIFAQDIILLDKALDLNLKDNNPNQVNLTGFLCKPVIFRKTPFGREISDLLLAINRSFNKSDYIPCIAWGKNAKLAQDLNIGSKIKIFGRMQSREYQKKISDSQIINKTAYEISIFRLKLA